ncbi:hypothetical protein ED92_10745 [Amycolatopsis sp. MJM2582]|nr:hypothetical protein ED92_10745 [Amycolatopsis sp. MJM2582]
MQGALRGCEWAMRVLELHISQLGSVPPSVTNIGAAEALIAHLRLLLGVAQSLRHIKWQFSDTL